MSTEDEGVTSLCCASTPKHTTLVEDPGIPLVGKNGGFHRYTDEGSTAGPGGLSGEKKVRKYDNVGYRLAKRKSFFHKRKILCDFALTFAVIGIILMIVETELYMAGVHTKTDLGSLLIKAAITISTVILLGFTVWYHVIDVKLFMCDNSLDDWRIAMSRRRVISILLELIIYAIHPIPGDYDFTKKIKDPENPDGTLIKVPVDVYLSLPMFLRLYLVCRVIMLHSRVFTDASSQSLGALNRIHFNFRFIFKSMMTLYPEYVLLLLTMSVFVLTSWMLRACEMYYFTEPQTRDFLNALYLVSITFLTVGYGDIVPHSYCGRGISVLAGFSGVLITALVVAVLARKLELSRAEKYVHNFVIDVELDKKSKIAAADILKSGWLVYKNKKRGNVTKQLKYQRKLLRSIHNMREVKQEQRRMVDGGITVLEMFRAQNIMHSNMELLTTRQQLLDTKADVIERKLDGIEGKLDRMLTSITHGRH